LGQISKDALESTCSSVPDFDAFGMSSDESVKDRVVQNKQSGLLISQMICSWLIVIVENQFSSSSHNPLRRACDGEAIDLIQRAVEGLNWVPSSHVPNFE
tara:strand:- start:1214 stop:1513 length:300 start_codon:yes stop_codon:yes gene_type:complete